MNKLGMLACFALLAPGWCQAAIINVNSTADLVDINPGNGICEASNGVGNCTLRAAVMETNILTGADQIIVPAGTYLLTIDGNDDTALAGDLDVTDTDLTITGAGAGSTIIDGNSLDRIFHIGVSKFVLQDITIRNGLVDSTSTFGGGISVFNSPNEIHLQGVHLTFNGAAYGGAIGGGNILTIQNSVIEDNYTLDLGGSGQSGPAIYCLGCDITIESSTFTQNHGSDSTIVAIVGQLSMLNSTVSGNEAGGVRTQNASAIIKFTTIVNNSGPSLSHFSNDGTLTFQVGNSVLQNDESQNCLTGGTLPISLGYNVVSDAWCSFAQTGDLQNTDAELLALADYGGATPTHLPADSSILIDQIPLDACTNIQGQPLSADQRGAGRPFAGICDIGAVEYFVEMLFKDGFE